ncbi:hypothetical protein AO382_0312 [Moraxella catarrhalis]|uniref:Uncharacterized protein n=1 Tax=Moraxella catarrhalis TaxID=480 RepID=A0A7Z0V053_MORCA|nr:hypothetical protein AO382_0312 [Moraxella catarrhalis]
MLFVYTYHKYIGGLQHAHTNQTASSTDKKAVGGYHSSQNERSAHA